MNIVYNNYPEMASTRIPINLQEVFLTSSRLDKMDKPPSAQNAIILRRSWSSIESRRTHTTVTTASTTTSSSATSKDTTGRRATICGEQFGKLVSNEVLVIPSAANLLPAAQQADRHEEAMKQDKMGMNLDVNRRSVSHQSLFLSQASSTESPKIRRKSLTTDKKPRVIVQRPIIDSGGSDMSSVSFGDDDTDNDDDGSSSFRSDDNAPFPSWQLHNDHRIVDGRSHHERVSSSLCSLSRWSSELSLVQLGQDDGNNKILTLSPSIAPCQIPKRQPESFSELLLYDDEVNQDDNKDTKSMGGDVVKSITAKKEDDISPLPLADDTPKRAWASTAA